MLQISQLYIYPIKSLGGCSVASAIITDRGFEHDRRWMLVDANNRFLSQREIPSMVFLQVEILAATLKVFSSNKPDDYIEIPFTSKSDIFIEVDIWGIYCKAQLLNNEINNWFSKILGQPCRLVYMTDSTEVKVEPNYAINNDLTSFSDGFPILMISEASLNDLNKRVAEPLPMNRFRPNLVFKGGQAFIEDRMKKFSINGILFFGVKPSSRCVVTTINQSTAQKTKEPLQTLATYRKKDSKIYFGENVIAAGNGKITIGDNIDILQLKESII